MINVEQLCGKMRYIETHTDLKCKLDANGHKIIDPPFLQSLKTAVNKINWYRQMVFGETPERRIKL